VYHEMIVSYVNMQNMRLSILPGKFGSRRGECVEEWKGGQH